MGLLKNGWVRSGADTNIPFRLMSLFLAIRDILFSFRKRIDQFGINKGPIVIGFGCALGGYVEHASQLVGDSRKTRLDRI
jgi:hypothetical protein